MQTGCFCFCRSLKYETGIRPLAHAATLGPWQDPHICDASSVALQHLQVDILVDSINDDGELIGRTQFDAPDVDPCVFLSDSPGMPPLEIGQLRRCQIHGSVLYDLEASPVC